ncbi:SEC-C metal-binding domain-containing protein [Pseudomonas fluorescens]
MAAPCPCGSGLAAGD